MCGTLWKENGTKTPSGLKVRMEISRGLKLVFAVNIYSYVLLHLMEAADPNRDGWLLLCRNEMECGSVVRGSRGYKKR